MYTKEKNAQIVISLLKQHGIRKVIASPGTTNVAFIGSIEKDPYFEIISAVDERSAAYMACGLAEETGEPVVISCTGATASRNYAPGMTEAYYRKIPVLALTSMQAFSNVGHHNPQVIDRSVVPNDVANLSVALPIVKDEQDLWDCEVKVNNALLELKRNGGGPVHINLPTTYTLPFITGDMPDYRAIFRITTSDILNKKFPPISKDLVGEIGIFIGSHVSFSEAETEAIEKFCRCYDAVVFCDKTSSYKGDYAVNFSLAASQEMLDKAKYKPSLMIHIGEVSGDYYTLGLSADTVWRISPDGELRDTFKKLKYVFEMEECLFFDTYSNDRTAGTSYYNRCVSYLSELRKNLPELPFSNLWVAKELSDKIPEGSTLHFGILNSLRSWNFFEVDKTIITKCNVGGFGIDGSMSTLIGASFSRPNSLYFCVLGDLAFFYDMNSIGNRHVGNNIRILLINNGKGTEFRQYNHHAAYFGESADNFIAASEHFGKKSNRLVKDYSEALGFKYIYANNKEEFLNVYEDFVSEQEVEKPIVFEVFTNSEEESSALKLINNIEKDSSVKIKKFAKSLISSDTKKFIKRKLNR